MGYPARKDWLNTDTGGRPSALTDKLAGAIAAEVRLGSTPREAAALCGVPTSTWYNWLERHAARTQPYAARIGSILLAEQGFVALQEQKLAGDAAWQATAFILKARRRATYGDKVEQTVVEAPKELTVDELRAKAIEMGLPEVVFER